MNIFHRVRQGNLRGKASEDAYLRTLPAVEVFSYQCSPLSTSAGIQVWRRFEMIINAMLKPYSDETQKLQSSGHLLTFCFSSPIEHRSPPLSWRRATNATRPTAAWSFYWTKSVWPSSRRTCR